MRPRGTGSIRALPSGSWEAAFQRDGRRVRRTFARRADAEAWLRNTAADRKAQLDRRPSLTLSDLANEYLADLDRRGLTPLTRAGHAGHLKIVLERWGDLKLAKIDPPRLRRILGEMHELGWSASTTRNRIDRITGMRRLAMELGHIEPRPIPVRRPPVTLASRPDAYSPEEVDALITAAAASDDPRHLAAVLLCADAGLRSSEALRVRPEDLQDGSLIVPVRSATDRPKSGRERVVPATTRLQAALGACVADGPVLGVAHSQTLRVMLRPTWREAGLDRVQLHRLRHAWATALARAGAEPLELMEWAGWSNPTMVRRYYHGPATARRELFNALER